MAFSGAKTKSRMTDCGYPSRGDRIGGTDAARDVERRHKGKIDIQVGCGTGRIESDGEDGAEQDDRPAHLRPHRETKCPVRFHQTQVPSNKATSQLKRTIPLIQIPRYYNSLDQGLA
jgi:hypothetical protein